MATACLAHVDDYRCSHISKVEANIGLIKTISGELLGIPGQRVSTVTEPYIAMLNKIEAELTQAGNMPVRG
jgi:hypothetical protein